uniref:DUF1674 domain-containing protein n=1 Tax=Pararhizobium sp. IMCC3301 TaxID=3067904 RepID=UPI002740C4D7|nr:DUF1674 domain-containing protein [Pararhizobium sp. IMCC3301]
MDKTADVSAQIPVRVPENATQATGSAQTDTGAGQALPAEAVRALAEAAARRDKAAAAAKNLPLEKGGRGGHDPARYGDWEINGRAVDF